MMTLAEEEIEPNQALQWGSDSGQDGNGDQKRGDELFAQIRRGIIGHNEIISTPYGNKKLLYADWCASGRLYRPIERFMAENVGPYVANTHTHSNATGFTMTRAYKEALLIIKRHVNAGPGDIVLSSGTGMTGAINKLQRLMGIRIPESFRSRIRVTDQERPVIFITHMEHHSNQTSWLETIGDVIIVPPGSDGTVSPQNLDRVLKGYRHRPFKIGAFTACSNVTGIEPPVHELARVMHRHGGLCFVDYSASAPYAVMNMHPADPAARLDAVLFSPHKFLGGPGTNGIMVFDSRLVRSRIPDHPGGGTVLWTDPWGGREYLDSLEEREDGGTPGFLQAIRTAFCIRLKETMGVERMRRKKQELLDRVWSRLDRIPRIRVLEGRCRKRQVILSIHVERLHYHLVTRILNDRFGIQARGGCSCAGSYAHFLYGIGPVDSLQIYDEVMKGNNRLKPGWVRFSLHPTMTLEEVDSIGGALEEIALNGDEWAKDYVWDQAKGDFQHTGGSQPATAGSWFESDAYLFEQRFQSL